MGVENCWSISCCMSSKTRCFVAVDLAEHMKAAIIGEQTNLKSLNLVHGTWEKKSNLHVTMRFMGELEDAELGMLQSKLSSVRFPKFTLSVGPVGHFGGEKNKPLRVIWAKISGAEYLQGEIDQALLPEFKPDKRHSEAMRKKAYTHHATICRVKSMKAPLQDYLEYTKSSPMAIVSQEVDSFVLMKSTLPRQGA